MTESLAHDSTGLRVRLESGKLGFAYDNDHIGRKEQMAQGFKSVRLSPYYGRCAESPEPDGLPFPAKSLAPLIHLAIIIF